jgi:hypothetical protein
MTNTTVTDPDLPFPQDNRPSRLNRPAGPVTGFDPDDIATVDAKVAAFWALHPDGAIDASDVEQVGEHSWRVTAHVWKNADSEGRADSTGSATRTLDLGGHISGQFSLETAQSVAIGRALRFLGIRAVPQ